MRSTWDLPVRCFSAAIASSICLSTSSWLPTAGCLTVQSARTYQNKVARCPKNPILFDFVSEISIQTPSRAQPRGRPASATREDVLALAMHRYLRGQRVDVQAIAGELGLGRTTIYRWFGSRDELLGEVLKRGAKPL